VNKLPPFPAVWKTPPLFIVTAPVTVIVLSVLLFPMVKVPVTDKLRRLLVFVFSVIVEPLGIITASPFAGTPDGLQSPAVFQLRAPEPDVLVTAFAEATEKSTPTINVTVTNAIRRILALRP
jgi:hypothetical protein